MKKPIIISVLFFVISSISSFGQGVWIQETVDAKTGLRTGKFEISGIVYEIKPNANLQGANLEGANLDRVNLEGANLSEAKLQRANLYMAKLDGAKFDGAEFQGASFGNQFVQFTKQIASLLDSGNFNNYNRIKIL